MKKLLSVAFLWLILLALFGCGGGSGGGDGTSPASSETKIGNATIQGIVSGTTIVAVDQNNNTVASVTATSSVTGYPNLKGFSLIVPIYSPARTYRFYLIENENTINEKIFPLYWEGANKFTISAAATINLSYVSTSAGIAVPTTTILIAGVSAAGKDTKIPDSLISAIPESGASLSSLVSSGLDYLKNGNILKAKAYFKAAVTNYPNDVTNDGDTARAFYAFTRVTSLGFNIYSDGNPADKNSLGDMFDLAGCSDGGRNIITGKMSCPADLPSTTPTGDDIKTFVNNTVLPELLAAITNLDAVSTSFSKTWTVPIDGKSYTSDYGDVLLLKTSIKAAVAEIYTMQAYNLNADIATAYNKKTSIQSFLVSNASFLTLASTATLATAKTYLSGAGNDLKSALPYIEAHGSSYLIKIPTDITATEITRAKAALEKSISALNGSSKINFDDTHSITINMLPFFAGLNLRNLLPGFSGNVPGFFPDATLGGVFVSSENMDGPNTDVYPADGIPDILQ